MAKRASKISTLSALLFRMKTLEAPTRTPWGRAPSPSLINMKNIKENTREKKKRTKHIDTGRFESGHSCSKEEKRENIIEEFCAVLKREIIGRL